MSSDEQTVASPPTKALEEIPSEVEALARRAAEQIDALYGITPEFDEASLALLDDLLANRLREMQRHERDAMLAAIGCYFGEVVRRRLNGRWAIPGNDPLRWRIELEPCFLHLSPIGMAGECLLGCEGDAYDGTFATREAVRSELEERLRRAPPLSEAEYYSLSGRLEVLELVADWLVAKQLVSADGARSFGPEDYRDHFASD
jgi:hypothetical protein